MPYKNLPKSKWAAMERCVRKVKAKGGVSNVYAVCYNSLMGGTKRAIKRKVKGRKK